MYGLIPEDRNGVMFLSQVFRNVLRDDAQALLKTIDSTGGDSLSVPSGNIYRYVDMDQGYYRFHYNPLFAIGRVASMIQHQGLNSVLNDVDTPDVSIRDKNIQELATHILNRIQQEAPDIFDAIQQANYQAYKASVVAPELTQNQFDTLVNEGPYVLLKEDMPLPGFLNPNNRDVGLFIKGEGGSFSQLPLGLAKQGALAKFVVPDTSSADYYQTLPLDCGEQLGAEVPMWLLMNGFLGTDKASAKHLSSTLYHVMLKLLRHEAMSLHNEPEQTFTGMLNIQKNGDGTATYTYSPIVVGATVALMLKNQSLAEQAGLDLNKIVDEYGRGDLAALQNEAHQIYKALKAKAPDLVPIAHKNIERMENNFTGFNSQK